MNAAIFGDSEKVMLVASELDGNSMICVREISMYEKSGNYAAD